MSRFTSPRMLLVLGLLVALCGAAIAQQRSAPSMATAATNFLASLTPEQRQRATFAFDSGERMRWHFVPQFERNGLQIREMTEPQRKLAHELLKTGLSARGYTTYTQIMQLENILKAVEKGSGPTRDPEGYRFSVFGTPAAKGTWGWRVEFHHVSLHFDVVNGTAISSTPSFAGANPAEVKDGPQKGQRTLGTLEDTARALVTALDESQRKTAIFTNVALNDIVTGNDLDIKPLSPDGIKGSAMTAAQRDLLMKILDAYAGLMAPDIAADRMAKVKKAGIENIGFAWAGSIERGQKHYYRMQGPTFLIEFDNTQNDGNHVHSVWRDFNGDFGRDLLREHLKSSTH
ncbi:MAG TPA: DUF3500 domain-containing protein [Vicinamibacterales bacterium]|jgi:uncharacterized protein DUF3500|nr:DUF3500 domain-containing protein [Vicinamibacterales bacterium]